MLTIKKRGLKVLWVIAAVGVLLTGCEPAGTRALLKGQKLLNAGKYSEAAAKFEEATTLMGDAPPNVQAQAWDWLGVARQYANQPKEALDAYNHALKLDRNLAPAAFNLGCLYLDYGNFRVAIDQFNTCLALPRGPEIRDVDIYLKIGLGYLRLAEQTPGAEKNRFFESARRYLDAVHKVSPGPEECNAMGLVLLKRNRATTEALARFKEALRLDPNYTPALLNMAVVHQQYLNDPRLALQEYQAYVAAPESPQNPKPVAAKDVEVIIQGIERQLAPAQPVVQPQPVVTNRPALTNVVVAPKPPPATNTTKAPVPAKTTNSSSGIETGKAVSAPKEKETVAEEKTRRSSTNSAAAASVSTNASPVAGTSTNGTSVTRIPDASKASSSENRYRYLASATLLVSGNHDEAARLVSQGFAAQQRGNKEEAMVCFQRAIKTDPRCYDAYYLLGGVARESGNLPVALDSLERAVSLKPESPDPRYAFAWTLSKAKFPQDCADELEKLLKQTPTEVRAHLLLANVYAQDLGMTRQAREHYQKVLDLEPNHPQGASIRNWLKATEGM